MFTFQAFPEDCKTGDAILHAKVSHLTPFSSGGAKVKFYPPPQADIELSDESTDPAPTMGALPAPWVFERRKHLILGTAAESIWVRTF